VAFTASDDVCTSGTGSTQCTTTGRLTPFRNTTTNKFQDGPGWSQANVKTSQESINGGKAAPTEGGYPFPNSLHPGGIVCVMCDGSTKFISDSIDGTVWSKLVTPSGEYLDDVFKQLPVDASAIGQ